ncbi:hypothetical protein BCR32DRAFT_282806 [Anaeromyces robustus]|uniref:CBM1 domain-containing protein n=1 Tax=Anaeromyces robustus TaxID=1754192 RepID=A0A1Y1WWP4_9FUNG|nr:hypothetical protein BCR32DRAFT_282806 [Anaeromyces robustus]|eukprot:ORX77882.1 hypothetical protein BCR32DRAFT_282806 [Anaeromyces robustus]
MHYNTGLLLYLLVAVLLFGASIAVPNGYSCYIPNKEYGVCQNYKGGCIPGCVKSKNPALNAQCDDEHFYGKKYRSNSQ